MRTYSQAIDYINGFINYERRKPPASSAEALKLDRIRDLLDRLGNPHLTYPAIHIAGTKGKGSTSAMIESMLRAAGYRTGLYTSPHLHTFRERMRAGGEPIGRDAFVRLVDEVEPHVAAIADVTWFEVLTALGFLHFARSGVNAGVIEVGLGGRFDATNVLTPHVSVITSLSLDHTAWLGDTLAQIAFEKAGIIKPGVPVVSAPQRPEAAAVLTQIAAERGAPLHVVGQEITFEPVAATLDGQTFKVHGLAAEGATPFNVPLLGAHQVVNAATALTAVSLANALGLPIDQAAMHAGLAQVRWPGRFEVARRDPPLIFDAAHNVDSALKLAAALEAVFPQRRWTLVFGALADKDIAGILDALLPCARHVVITRAQNARAADAESIAGLLAERQRPVQTALSVKDALDQALAADGPVIVTGSLSVVAEAREAWFGRIGAPLPDRDG